MAEGSQLIASDDGPSAPRRLVRAMRRRARRLQVDSSRRHLRAFAAEAAASLPEGSRMLDAGSGSGIYRGLFDAAQYESADFAQVEKGYGHITYVCDLADVPVEDARYDLVLLTQVLEHLPEPAAVLREMHRVLKPGSQLWLSAPLFYFEHEAPYDFYRYTQYGLRYLLESAGFEIERLEWLEGYLGTLSFQFVIAAGSLPRRPRDYGGGLVGLAAALAAVVLRPALWMLSLALARLDVRHKSTGLGMCKNYVVVARRATSPSKNDLHSGS